MRIRQTLQGMRQIAVVFFTASILGCGARTTGAGFPRTESALLGEINALRTKTGLPPLAISEILTSTARQRAVDAASGRADNKDENRLPLLVKAGAFARFSLSHAVAAPTFGEGGQKIITDTLSKSKLLHPALTHVGIGVEKKSGVTHIAVDMAKLVPLISDHTGLAVIQQKLDEKRVRNSLELLTENNHLNAAADTAAKKFMDGNASSDEVLATAQAALKSETFAFGRMTVSFQSASDLGQAVIPERAGDPSLAFAGIGIAQGNRADLEAGSVAVVIILAEPQTAHDGTRSISALPPPKAQPRAKIATDKPLTDQAWTATLTGNHSKAAKLFEKAYQQTPKPSLLYEAARAHARNDNAGAALKDMRLYAKLAEGEDKLKAMALIAKLESGESIFSASKDEQMSVEAKRFFVMGQLLFEQKEWDGAVDAFQQAYKFSATPEIVYNIGLAHYRAGRIGEALNFFGEYQRLVPGAADVAEARQFFDIGVELYQSGRFEAASLQFAMAYSFLPFPELVYNLALCYKAMGEDEKATRFFREYLENELPSEDQDAVRKIIRELAGKKQ